MKKRTGRLTLALLMASFMMSALNAKENVDAVKVTDNNAPAVIADAVTNLYTPPSDVPPKPPEEAIVSTTIQTIASDEPGPSEAIEAATVPAPVAPEVIAEALVTDRNPGEAEPSWYAKAWSYLKWDEISYKQKAVTIRERYRLRGLYGDSADDEPNYTVLRQMERDSAAADEVRQQKHLALEVKEAERLKLYNESLECLALNGYHESRSETADQEVASAAVVLNRLSVGFRDATTVCEVIYTPKQFSWVEQHGIHTPDTSNKVERRAWERSLMIARRMLDPDATYIDPSNGAQYYYNPEIVDWKYAYAYKQVAILGNHRFMAEQDKSHPHYIDNTQVRINPVFFNGMSHEERKLLISEYQTI